MNDMNSILYVVLKPAYKKYELDAWSTNPYLISKYISYNSNKLLKTTQHEFEDDLLSQNLIKIKEIYDIPLDKLIESELMMTFSLDNKICVIYKSRYEYSFGKFSDIDKTISFEIINNFIRTFLSCSPIVKYFYNYDELLNIIFYGYMSLTNKYEVDMVYVWAYLVRKDDLGFISNYHRDLIPFDAVFIGGR